MTSLSQQANKAPAQQGAPKGAPAPMSQRVNDLLVNSRENIESVLSAKGVPFDRFQATVVSACQKTPELLKVDRNSVIQSCLQAALDGLMPNGREAALVIYGEKDKRTQNYVKKAQYMPMYQGILKFLHDNSDLFSIQAEVAYANDEFEIQLGSSPSVKHMPFMKGERGEAIAAYACFYSQDGNLLHLEYMTKADIDRAKAVAKTDMVWKKWPGEMMRKTVIRRGAKYVPLTNDARKVIERLDELVDITPSEQDRRTDEREELMSMLGGSGKFNAAEMAGDVVDVEPF